MDNMMAIIVTKFQFQGNLQIRESAFCTKSIIIDKKWKT
jgi:hypothetical protein